MIEQNSRLTLAGNRRSGLRIARRILASASLLFVFGAAGPVYISVSSQEPTPTASAGEWPLVEAKDVFFLELPERILGYAATASAPIPGNYLALQAKITATLRDPEVLQSTQIALIFLLLLVGVVDHRRIAAFGRDLSRAAWAKLVSTARTIVELAEQPAPRPNNRLRTFEPLLRIAEPVPYKAWPTMATFDYDCVAPAPRPRPAERPAAAPGPAPEAAATPTLARYCFYSLNQWGIVDCRTDHSFASDAAAFTHAGRIAGTGRTEVWRDGVKLGTISGEAAAPDYRMRAYA
ncbi:hypothetical protein [Glacieibacterium frigidum]|uniref:Uncharacterized protein n=1 Tax=Glacieibacterium frigidum TaxID=2593303 RepID=A0A552UIP8_9SPHN|nr:hypothetical protein [Glacieibacterium frigidum]TRW18106.1 hypothetical protein FMM06_08365 [Glacieibacterium frigidum]